MGTLPAQKLKEEIILQQQFEALRGDEAKGQIKNLSAPPTDLPGSVQGWQNPSIGVQEGEHEKTPDFQTHELARTAARKGTAAMNVSKEAAKLDVHVENESSSTSSQGKNSELFKVALSPAMEGPQPPAQTKIPLQPSVPVGHGNKVPDSLTAQVAGNHAERSSTSQTPWLAMDKAAVVSQLIDKARLLAGKHNGELVIFLKPEFLGRLCLQAAMVGNELVATITAESHQVKQMLESHLPALQTSLQEQGLQVSKIMVVQGNDINFSDFQQHQSNNRQNPRAGEPTPTLLAEKFAQGEEVSDLPLLGQIPSSSLSHGINLLA
jgi:flagellar hook-length control protein FliK